MLLGTDYSEQIKSIRFAWFFLEHPIQLLLREVEFAFADQIGCAL
jgi:hypothetical protein